MLRRNQDSKLGAGVPRHAAWLCRAAHLGKGGASPARCIPPEQRRVPRCMDNQERLAPPIPPASGFRARHHDETRPVPRPSPNRAPVGYAGHGLSCPDTTTSAISHSDQNQERLAPPIPPASGFRARHHDERAFRLSTPDQARAAWIGASVRRWTRPGGEIAR